MLFQYHFDEAGIGLERIKIKRKICGYEPLETYSYKLRKLIDALRKEYKRRLNDKINGDRPW